MLVTRRSVKISKIHKTILYSDNLKKTTFDTWHNTHDGYDKSEVQTTKSGAIFTDVPFILTGLMTENWRRHLHSRPLFRIFPSAYDHNLPGAKLWQAACSG